MRDLGASPDGDRAVVNGAGQAVSALRASVPSAWRAWKGPAGDDLIICGGLGALVFYIVQNGGFPDPLPVAVFASLLVLGRRTDRAQAIEAASAAETQSGSVHESAVGCKPMRSDTQPTDITPNTPEKG